MRDVVKGEKQKERMSETEREREKERNSDEEWGGSPVVDYPGGVRQREHRWRVGQVLQDS